MAEVTEEIGIAINNTKHLLSQISGERIRDEFIKGIKTSKSTKHFLGLLAKYNLLSQVFPNITSTDKFMESNDPDLVIASLLVGTGELNKVLNRLKYPDTQIKNIHFLTMLPKLNTNVVYEMKKLQGTTTLSNEQIKQFANFNGLDNRLIDAFLNFNLTVKGGDVMNNFNVKGPDIGKKVKELEIANFKAEL